MARWKKCVYKEGKMCLHDGVRVGLSDCRDCQSYRVEEVIERRLDTLASMDPMELAETLYKVLRDKGTREIYYWLTTEMKDGCV